MQPRCAPLSTHIFVSRLVISVNNLLDKLHISRHIDTKDHRSPARVSHRSISAISLKISARLSSSTAPSVMHNSSPSLVFVVRTLPQHARVLIDKGILLMLSTAVIAKRVCVSPSRELRNTKMRAVVSRYFNAKAAPYLPYIAIQKLQLLLHSSDDISGVQVSLSRKSSHPQPSIEQKHLTNHVAVPSQTSDRYVPTNASQGLKFRKGMPSQHSRATMDAPDSPQAGFSIALFVGAGLLALVLSNKKKSARKSSMIG